MEVILRTNKINPALRLGNMKLFPDDSGGCCFLEVKSGAFSASIDFYFDAEPWKAFLRDLELLDHTLKGVARLGQTFEKPYIELRGSGNGHITVSGLLLQQGYQDQVFEFEFVTDQTVLGPFLADLREVQRAYVT
jgi:hypothetical protein